MLWSLELAGSKPSCNASSVSPSKVWEALALQAGTVHSWAPGPEPMTGNIETRKRAAPIGMRVIFSSGWSDFTGAGLEFANNIVGVGLPIGDAAARGLQFDGRRFRRERLRRQRPVGSNQLEGGGRILRVQDQAVVPRRVGKHLPLRPVGIARAVGGESLLDRQRETQRAVVHRRRRPGSWATGARPASWASATSRCLRHATPAPAG